MEDSRLLGKTTLVEDIMNIAYSITTEATEKFDEFVFTTVQPYCENKTQMHVSKEQLINALTKQKPIEPIVDEANAWNDFRTRRYCAICKSPLVKKDKFCRQCGQAVKTD